MSIDKDFNESETETETNESREELKVLKEYDSDQPIVIILDDVKEKKMNDSRVQALITRSRHHNISTIFISQDCYEPPEKTVWANGNILHIFKSNKYGDIQNLHQDEASMDMTLNEFICLISSSWEENYQPLINELTKDKFTGRYR